MAERITQELGFDASKAISELRSVQEQLRGFNQALKTLSARMDKFPKAVQPAVSAIRQLGLDANKTRTELAQLGVTRLPGEQIQQPAQQAATAIGNLATTSNAAGQAMQTTFVDAGAQISTSLRTVGQSTSQAAQAVQAGSQQINSGATQATTAVTNVGNAGKKAAKDITLSWETMIRVVQTQIIVRIMHGIIRSFQEASREARELSRDVAEALTIDSGALGSLDQATASIRELSVHLGITAEEVARGTYQVLSNQVVEAADALEFAEQAGRLAIATNTELGTAVNALSSVMNSYNLEVSETERVSDTLFKTIEHGRLRLDEFGGAIGRVSPVTAALGVQYDEMSAALAAITRAGVPVSTAITQLLQVSQKLLRPTESLQNLYREWGVETGPEAIARFGGLEGVLTKMAQATAGNDTEFANLLGTVRAVVGAFTLAADEGAALSEIKADMANSTNVTRTAMEQMEESLDRRLKRAMVELSAEMHGAGLAMAEWQIYAVQASTFVMKNSDMLTAALMGVAGAAGLAGVKMGLAAASAKGLSVALTALAVKLWPLLAVGAATYGILQLVRAYQEAQEAASNFADSVNKEIKENQDTYAKAMSEVTDQHRRELEQRRRDLQPFFDDMSRQYRENTELVRIQSSAVRQTLEDQLNQIFQQRTRAIDAVKTAVLEADRAIKASSDRILSDQQSIDDILFNRTIRGLSDVEESIHRQSRAFDAAVQAREAFATAGMSDESRRAALELSNLAERRARESLAAAERVDNVHQIRAAENALLQVINDRIAFEEQGQSRLRELQESVSTDQLRRLEQIDHERKALTDRMLEQIDLLNKKDAFKTDEERARDERRFKELYAQLEELSREAEGIIEATDLVDATGLVELQDDLMGAITTAFRDAHVDFLPIRDNLQSVLRAQPFAANLELALNIPEVREALERELGRPIGIEIDTGMLMFHLETVRHAFREELEKAGIDLSDQSVNVKELVEGINESLKQWPLALDESNVSMYQLLKGATLGVEYMDENTQAARNYAVALKDHHTRWGEITEQIEAARQAGQPLDEETRRLAEGHIRISEHLRENNQLIEQGATSEKNRVKWLRQVLDTLKGETVNRERHRAILQDLDPLQRAWGENAERLQGTTDGAAMSLDEARDAVRGGSDAMLDLSHHTHDARQSIEGLTPASEAVTAAIEEVAANIAEISVADLIQQTTTLAGETEDVTEAMRPLPNLTTLATTAAKQLDDQHKNVDRTINLARGSIGQVTSGTQQSIQAANQLAAAWSRVAAEAAKAAAAGGGAGVTAAHGGRYFATGGRGTDRIPAMLSRGEFVVNAKSARQFFPQLQAMNAGHAPVYREQGGSVTNVGDINVSVQGGDTAQQTIREIASGLRRELRRGTIRLD